MIEEADRISRHQSTQGVSNDAELRNMHAFLLQGLQLLLDFLGNPFATNFDAIICEISGIALWQEDVNSVLGKLLAQGLR